MRLSLSNIHFIRKLSVQREESGVEENDANEDSSSGPLIPVSRNPDGTITIPNPVPYIHPEHGIMNDLVIDENEKRKLSIASTTSNHSEASITSSCSAPPGMISTSCPSEKKFELYGFQVSRRLMTSRPSFISLCSIVSETSESPTVTHHLLPAPLQVELDFMQRSGVEGDEPTCRSHLPVLRCPSDYDINELDVGRAGFHLFHKNHRLTSGFVKGIKEFPNRMRKMSTEKNRFDLYSISDETREQLKQLYVY